MSDPVDPYAPAPETASPAAPPQASPAPAAPTPAGPTAMAMPPWSSLDSGARNVVIAAAIAAIALIVGGLVGAWPSGDFTIIALLAALIALGAAWLGDASPAPIRRAAPATVVASLAAAVVAVLGIWRLIEVAFDFDQLDEVGGIVGAALIAIVGIAGAGLLLTAIRRDTATAAAIRSSDRSVRLALLGLGLVLLGWGVNLASYWTMRQATPTLVLLTLAALIIVLAGGGLPPLATWVGIVLAGIGALVALDLWGQLTRLGATRLDLGVTDYLPFIVYVVGLALILAAGVQAVMLTRVGLPAPPSTTG